MGLRQDITRLFNKKSSKRETLRGLLEHTIGSGQFYRFSIRKRTFLITKLHKLTRRVNQLKWHMKVAAMGGTMAAITNSQDALAQSQVGPFVQQRRAFNPLRNPLIYREQKPTAVDLDNDGDIDIVAGEANGYYSRIRIYLNEGDRENPAFSEYYALDENGDPIVTYGGAPAFADLNGDGDLDMVYGWQENYSSDRIQFFVGNGGIPGDEVNPLLFTAQTGVWDPVLKTGNPFNSIAPGSNLTIAFVNFDGDSDLDVLIGHNYSIYGDGLQVHYYENDGQSNFTEQPFGASVVGYSSYRAAPQIADIDQDGNLDLVVGRLYGDLLFFKGDGAGNFNQQTGPWDPALKTGNPFFGIDPGYQSAPAFVDLDNDGDLDLVMGIREKYISRSTLQYLENIGGAEFEQKSFMENPFDGIHMGYSAIPNFLDVDDDGDLDAVLGGKYDGSNSTQNDAKLTIFENKGNVEFGQPLNDLPLNQIASLSYDYDFAPLFVNIDDDADLEVVVGSYNEIDFFDLVDGEYVKLTGTDSPFYGLLGGDYNDNMRLAMGDMDGDGDLDLFVGGDLDYPYGGKIRFFENTGTASSAAFTERTGSENPLNAVANDYDAIPHLIDIDNDGDLDAIITEPGFESDYGNDVLFFENTGNPTNPIFTLRTSHPIAGIELPESYNHGTVLGFVDLDQDGDFDFFAGTSGTFKYYVNSNPAPVTTLATSVLSYQFGAASVIVDANLTISDTDNDLISRATISIQNFQVGNESLNFTAQAPITGNFDSTTGILTLQGNASLSAYQSVLRTVTYSYNGPDPGARKGNSGRVKSLTRTISFEVLDEDRTAPIIASRTISVASQANSAPIITVSNLSTVINNLVTIDLNTIISDPDGNLDPLTFAIIPNEAPTPARVGNASISNEILTINYAGTDFAGTDFVTIQACDTEGLCATAEITIQVDGDIIVRNGISPNGDGLNDFFRLDNIVTLGGQNKVQIFNRWGDKVFEINDYDNLNRRFEGKSDGGNDLPSGVYFYKISFTDGRQELSGYLTLKR